MKIQKTWAVFFLTLTLNLTTNAAEMLPETVEVPRPFPSPLTQDNNDCAINAVASAIEYVTTPRVAGQKESPLLPIKVSRSFLYTVGLDAEFNNKENWEKGDYSALRSDCGVSMVTGLLTASRYGCPPEEDVTLADGRKISGWSYEMQGKPIPPSIFRIGLDTSFDGIPADLKPSLLKGSIVRAKELYDEENPYAKIKTHLFYEVINRPAKFTADFYAQIRDELSQGHPIVMGMSVPADFMTAKGKSVIQGRGGLASDMHVVLLLGMGTYYGQKDCFYIQNSWGKGWGLNGRAPLSKKAFEENFYGGYAVSAPGFFEESDPMDIDMEADKGA